MSFSQLMIESFSKFLIFFIFVAFLFLIFLTLFTYSFQNRKLRPVRKLAPYMITLIVISFSLQLTSRYFLFHYVITELRNPQSMVTIDGVAAPQDVREYLSDVFANRTQSKMSGSHPINTAELEIGKDDYSLVLFLRQDSRDKELYWVFLDKGRIQGNMTFIKIRNSEILSVN
ncbi:hypothetical protein CWE13_07960 [Aliidiomarina shirensis]|uniref:Uncharacterized protein n=1 Tax=Aliidiomarina shirensis TaxID=1048642 RepID=A0A432WSN6_9GAMM|nr:hypothetical protein [Aliidiomarina shirensis]RUO36776.1 hypothetical protein CWE13_07960 [Aliidiomarina shirensis]